MDVDGSSDAAAGSWGGGPEEAGAALCASGLLLGFLSRNLLEDVVLPGATFSRLQQQVSWELEAPQLPAAALLPAVVVLAHTHLHAAASPLTPPHPPPLCWQGSAAAGSDPAAVSNGTSVSPTYMTLDGAALENLEVLSNSAGGSVGSLAGLLDHTTSPWGRRRLRGWLARPLARVADICARQDAVEVGTWGGGGTGEGAGGSLRRRQCVTAGCLDKMTYSAAGATHAPRSLYSSHH